MSITFTVQVIVDGSRPYHGSFELNSISPQEIEFEQRSFKSSRTKELPSSQAKKRLSFPRSDKDALLQSSTWHPRGTDNRIKVVLSEQLVNDDDSLDVGHWDIVCFSFQHAPRDLLEQAGIAYPIADPLRTLMAERATLAVQSASRNTTSHELQRGSHIHARISLESDSEPFKPANRESRQQPPNQMPSLPQYPPQFIDHRGGGHPGIWYNAYGTSGDSDTMSMTPFPSQRYASNVSGLEGFYDPSFPAHALPLWTHNAAFSGQQPNTAVKSRQPRKDSNAQQVMMALREDQFGQILEALSPSKAGRSKPNGLPAKSQCHRPPKIGALSVPVRPSSAVIARSIPELNPSSRNRRPFSDQVNFEASAPAKQISKKEIGQRVHTPIPFMLAPQRLDSDVSMRDGSSNTSSLSRLGRDTVGLGSGIGSVHGSAAIKNRKEGRATDMDDPLDLNVRYDQSLLNASTNATEPDQTPRNNRVEVIDVDAIDPSLTADLAKLSPFKPSHKAGMSSVSSTGRLERQLYSALGEELGSFERMIGNEMGPEPAKAPTEGRQGDVSGSTMLGPTGDFEPIKRKRQGTLGGERDSSPLKKKERQAMVEDEDIPDDMSRLRGD
ncbi:hypothetical protein E8E12_004038 [Didymella heteroderae]|uniref:Uncharacterized protein n=1 Tax=Didymella heteroderae TaxID=1769908 RepID=A0A9P4WTR3_9PLEO|nr:hypothetical protein E8E12_004038 [Didymella heteroderae]